MATFSYLSGILTSLAALILLFPWLRNQLIWDRLLGNPRRVVGFALVPLAMIAILYAVSVRPDTGTQVARTDPAMTTTGAAGTAGTAGSFAVAAKTFASANGDAVPPVLGAKSDAGSMDAAIANLEARLAKGGGSDGDWELLAKSFEFLGRPAAAAQARAHQLPELADAATRSGGLPVPPPGTVVSGEVNLSPAMSGKAASGETLFIVAKSVDSPGIPVAVFRTSVGAWPLKFTLDDSQSMMPGRTLSSAGRVTIEARISHNGQPLPASGDLQGTSGVINPADHRPLEIVIDHPIS